MGSSGIDESADEEAEREVAMPPPPLMLSLFILEAEVDAVPAPLVATTDDRRRDGTLAAALPPLRWEVGANADVELDDARKAAIDAAWILILFSLYVTIGVLVVWLL